MITRTFENSLAAGSPILSRHNARLRIPVFGSCREWWISASTRHRRIVDGRHFELINPVGRRDAEVHTVRQERSAAIRI